MISCEDFLRSEGVLRGFLDSLLDFAIVFLDKEGNIVDWNLGARTLKGYTRDEVLGKHFSAFYTPEAQAVGHPERELALASSTGRYEEEGWRVRKDGTRFWAHVIIIPIYDENMILRGFGKIVRDFTRRKQETEQSANVMRLLELTARTDYLTGLDNRRALDKMLASALPAGLRHRRSTCLAMVDIDLFKKFNDEFGHEAGDVYLKRAAVNWRGSLRTEDFLARYGGEEFVVVLPDTDAAAATLVLNRLRAATPSPLTCSIGIAEWDKKETPDRFIGRADHALYQAKTSGRNRVTIALMPEPVSENPRQFKNAASKQDDVLLSLCR
jgi:diguanylate cyclase (GGDEF)-like protein/PAS domain S-box-containing protein